MLFSTALVELRSGKKLRRTSWPSGSHIVLQTIPASREEKQLPYILHRTSGGRFVPWTATHCDILGEDWKIV